jgi:hypothetical protein
MLSSAEGPADRLEPGRRGGIPSWASVAIVLALAATAYAVERLVDPRMVSTGHLGWTDIVALALLVVVVPAYLLAVGRRRRPADIIVRGLLWACAGALVAKAMIPPSHHEALSLVAWIRYVKWPVAAIVELQILLFFIRAFRRDRQSPEQAIDALVRSGKLHPWIARVARYEHRMWRFVFRRARRLLRIAERPRNPA